MKKYRKIMTKSGNISRVVFDSVTEMIEHAMDENECPEKNRSVYNESLNRKAGIFSNNYTVERVKNEMLTPPQATSKVRDLIGQIESEHEFSSSRRYLARRREDGDELGAVAWVQRDPNGWSRMERTSSARQVIRIAINLVVNGSKKAEDLYYRGAAAVALADALEAAGHSVEVVAFDAVKGSDTEQSREAVTVLECCVKRPDMPMDVDTLSLVLSEIGFYRTMGFLASINACAGKMSYGLGRPADLPKVEADKFDIVMDSDVFSYKAAMEIVTKYATKFTA